MEGKDAGLLPVKKLSAAKSRLGAAFSDGEREEIARALLYDALELCASADFLQWSVMSADNEVLAAARERGLGVMGEGAGGLNPAITAAVARLAAMGASSLTIVPADIPLAQRSDIVDILDTGATSDVVVVPSHRDGGTNALHMRPPGIIEPRFGAGSLAAHVRLAESHGIRCSLLPLPRVQLDIDTVEDVDSFLDEPRPVASKTADVLKRLRGRAGG